MNVVVKVVAKSLLVPATAAVITGVVVVGPVTAPTPAQLEVPTVAVESIRLAGIGQDIYNVITPVVQEIVAGGSYLVNFIPVVGAVTAAQININYFQAIQPSIAATVDYAAAVLHDPRDFIPITGAYVRQLSDIGYGYVSAQLRFLGLPELPPRAAAAVAVQARPAAASDPGDKPLVSPPEPEVRTRGRAVRELPVVRQSPRPAAAVTAPDRPEKPANANPGRRGHDRRS